MYSYIRGEIAEISTDSVVIDNNGIGYQVFLPVSDLSKAGPVGETRLIYTYFQVSENGIGLYGFLTKGERELFLLLITVNGVGPKAAMSILSVLSENDLRFAILSEDAKAISKAPGVGPKTAKMVILTLKDKIDPGFMENAGTMVSDTPGQVMADSDRNDAYLALTSLGYDAATALKALDSVEGASDMSSEQLLKEALKKLVF